MTAISPSDRPATARTCQMHRIHASTVVALALGVLLTLVVALQMLPTGGTADAAAPASVNAALLPLPVFIVCAALTVLVSAAVLVSATARARD